MKKTTAEKPIPTTTPDINWRFIARNIWAPFYLMWSIVEVASYISTKTISSDVAILLWTVVVVTALIRHRRLSGHLQAWWPAFKTAILASLGLIPIFSFVLLLSEQQGDVLSIVIGCGTAVIAACSFYASVFLILYMALSGVAKIKHRMGVES